MKVPASHAQARLYSQHMATLKFEAIRSNLLHAANRAGWHHARIEESIGFPGSISLMTGNRREIPVDIRVLDAHFASDLALRLQDLLNSKKAVHTSRLSPQAYRSKFVELLDVVIDQSLGFHQQIERAEQVLQDVSLKDEILLVGGLEMAPFFRAVQLGPFFYLDQALDKGLPSKKVDELRGNLLWLDSMQDTIVGAPDLLKLFSFSSLLPLLYRKWPKFRVIDCGAGDGFLWQSVLRLGAKAAYAIEHNADMRRIAASSYHINFPDQKPAYFDLAGDLCDTQDLARRIPHEPEPILLLSNIGDWKEYPGVNNRSSLLLARELLEKGQPVTHVLLGAYLKGSETNRPSRDFDFAAKLGFTKTISHASVGDTEAFLLVRKHT